MSFNDPKLQEKIKEARNYAPNRVKKLLFNKKMRKEHYFKVIKPQLNIDESSNNQWLDDQINKDMKQRLSLENT